MDKGGEFASAEFKLWLKDRGIERVKVGPASSQQNPCERVHRTLMEMMRAMLEQSGMPRMFGLMRFNTRFISRTEHLLEAVIVHRMKRCLASGQKFIIFAHLALWRIRMSKPTHGVTS